MPAEIPLPTEITLIRTAILPVRNQRMRPDSTARRSNFSALQCLKECCLDGNNQNPQLHPVKCLLFTALCVVFPAMVGLAIGEFAGCEKCSGIALPLGLICVAMLFAAVICGKGRRDGTGRISQGRIALLPLDVE